MAHDESCARAVRLGRLKQFAAGRANATTMFGIESVPLLAQATWLEFAGGLSAKILPGLSIYAQAGYQFAVSDTDGGRRDGVKGNFGAHYTW